MQPSNALQQMLRAPHRIEDPGDGETINIDRDRFYISLDNSSAGSETRTLSCPPGRRENAVGLVGHLGCISCTAGSVVVTVKDSAGSTTGTITFSSDSQWIGLIAVETTAGVFAWQATDVYGCSTTIQTAQNWSAAVANGTMTNLVVQTAISAASILATNLSVATQATIPNILCSSNLSVASILGTNISCASMSVSSAFNAKSVLATNISIGTGLTAPNIVANTAISAASILVTNLSVGTQATIPNILCSSNLSVASALATNVSIGTGLTANAVRVGTGGINQTLSGANTVGLTTAISSASTQSLAVALPPAPLVAVSVSGGTAYVKMPAAAVGILMSVANIGSNAFTLCANSTNASCGSATLLPVAATGAAHAGAALWCDGTNWFQVA